VVSVGGEGTWIEFLPPAAAPGTLAAAAVANPDGQVALLGAAVLYEGTSPPAVEGFDPPEVVLQAGSSLTVGVRIRGIAPSGGTEVSLEASGGVATVPPSTLVPPFRREVAFDLVAGPLAGHGEVRASCGGGVAVLPVTVTAPPPPPAPAEADLSGWRLLQANSARTLVLPAGTRLRAGETLVVGRKASQAAFEAFWGRSLGAGTLYLDSEDKFPVINGGETFRLEDVAGATIESPTIAAVAGSDHRRRPGRAPGDAASWIVQQASQATATPGVGEPLDGAHPGVYVSEFSDAAGTGNFVYEFVEVRFDP